MPLSPETDQAAPWHSSLDLDRPRQNGTVNASRDILNVLAISNDGWNVCGFYLGFLEIVHGLARHDNVSLFMQTGATERKKKPLPNEVRFNVRGPAKFHLLACLLSFYQYMREYWVSIRSADVVLANSEVSSIILGVIAKWLLKAKLVIVVWEIEDIRKKPLLSRISYYHVMYLLYRGADLILVPSALTLRAVRGIVPEKPIRRVGAIVHEPPRDFATAKNPFLVCVIGVVDRKKHPETVVQVVRLVRDLTNSDMQLIWIGDGGLRSNFVGHEFARFIGDVDDEQKWRVLLESSVYLMCSDSEGFNLTIGEALNCGTPVVAFDLPVYHEIYDDAAVLVRWGDREAMARQVIRVLDSPDLRRELVEKGKRIMGDYSESEVTRRVRKALLDIVSNFR